jgi:hypothetical protein
LWPIPSSSIIVILTAAGIAGMFLFFRPLVLSAAWRATITPLASIMGSGFLVCAPLLYANAGNYAVLAMAGLLCLAYAVGSVIRFNIRYGEPILETQNPPADFKREEHKLHVAHRNVAHRVKAGQAVEILEKTSHVVLSGAYFISVSYYLQLLSSFTLQPFSLDQVWLGKALVTLILAALGTIGILRGLKGIERIERIVVSVNLSMIAALTAGLIYYNIAVLGRGAWHIHALPLPPDKLHMIRVLMGMLVVIQGFETSRFLGSEHPPEVRVKTMRLAQLLSSGIYLIFIALMAVVMNKTGDMEQTGITAIVGLSKIVAPILPILIMITAIGSQFSAATADDAGCSGLLESLLKSRGPAGFDYLIVSGMAVAITWITDVYQIISFASRAFALYYAIQCVIAILVVKQCPSVTSRAGRNLLYGALAVICTAITCFGIPAG